jgi:catalase
MYVLWPKFGYYKFDKKKISPYFPIQHVGIASLVQQSQNIFKEVHMQILHMLTLII